MSAPRYTSVPRLVYALLCDDVRVEAEGHKQTVVGVFDRFTVPEVPGPLPPFMLFLRLLFDAYEVEYHLTIDIRRPSGEIAPLLSGRATVTKPDEIAAVLYAQPMMSLKFRFDVMLVSEVGLHALVFRIDGEEIGTVPFLIRQKEAAAATAG